MLSCFTCVQLFVTPVDCRPPGSSVHGILQARILEWVAMPSFRGLLHPRSNPHLTSPALARGFFTTSTTWEAPLNSLGTKLGPHSTVLGTLGDLVISWSFTGYRLCNQWDKSGGHVPLIRGARSRNQGALSCNQGARSFLHCVVCRCAPTLVSCE